MDLSPLIKWEFDLFAPLIKGGRGDLRVINSLKLAKVPQFHLQYYSVLIQFLITLRMFLNLTFL